MWPRTYDNWTSGVVWKIVVELESLKAMDDCWEVELGNIVNSTGVEKGLLWATEKPLPLRFAVLDAKVFPSSYYNIDD